MAEKQTTEKQSTFKELVLPVIVLVVICLVCSALLAVLNDITAPIIAETPKPRPWPPMSPSCPRARPPTA